MVIQSTLKTLKELIFIENEIQKLQQFIDSSNTQEIETKATSHNNDFYSE